MSEKKSKSSGETEELKLLRAQVRGMEILLVQNADLEKEVERLNLELDDATVGVQKKGYLYKYRDREIYYASKWGLRYFVLQGNTLSYFGDDHERRPRRTIDLSKCFVRNDGTKKGGMYHAFSVYMSSDNQEGSLLLRLSADSAAECRQWVDMLEQACAIGDVDFAPQSPTPYKKSIGSGKKHSRSHWGDSTDKLSPIAEGEGGTTPGGAVKPIDDHGDWGHVDLDTADGSAIEGTSSIPSPKQLDKLSAVLSSDMLSRVKSSSLILQKSMSRQSLARRVVSKRDPTAKAGSLSIGSPGKDSSTPSKSKATSAAGATSTASAAAKKEDLPKSFPGYKPMHITNNASPLSSEAPTGMHNYRGFFNLGVIVLVLTHLDLIVNNMTKYGLKIALPVWTFSSTTLLQVTELSFTSEAVLQRVQVVLHRYQSPLSWLAFWVVCVLVNFIKEKIASRNLFKERVILVLNYIINTLVIVLPCYWIWFAPPPTNPSANMLYLFQSVIMWMKMVSYSHANKDLRVATRKDKKADLTSSSNAAASGDGVKRTGSSSAYNSSADLTLDNNAKPVLGLQQVLSEVKDLQPPFLLYPQNLTLKNVGYFCIAPTLCYQLNYPRTKSIRWSNVFMILFRLAVIGIMVVFAVEQYIKPTLESVIIPMKTRNVLKIAERLLKLSIPSTYVWLLGFYFYFHLWLNLLAELTRFGDRQFYKDWWNAKTIDRYWRTWNMPVHHWITRHLYYPLIRVGASKLFATFVVFFFSAALHELIISLPFQHISMHAFLGMFGQAPLIVITKFIDKKFDNPFIGNAFFWCVFCIVGQPMGVILYYYDLWSLSNGVA